MRRERPFAPSSMPYPIDGRFERLAELGPPAQQVLDAVEGIVPANQQQI